VSLDILAALGRGEGPDPALVVLGYAGWGRGQLDAEIQQNSWLTVPADPAIIFDTPFEQRWASALGLPGVDIRRITNYAGHA
jgi:putative transcriptional regulator